MTQISIGNLAFTIRYRLVILKVDLMSTNIVVAEDQFTFMIDPMTTDSLRGPRVPSGCVRGRGATKTGQS